MVVVAGGGVGLAKLLHEPDHQRRLSARKRLAVRGRRSRKGRRPPPGPVADWLADADGLVPGAEPDRHP